MPLIIFWRDIIGMTFASVYLSICRRWPRNLQQGSSLGLRETHENSRKLERKKSLEIRKVIFYKKPACTSPQGVISSNILFTHVNTQKEKENKQAKTPSTLVNLGGKYKRQPRRKFSMLHFGVCVGVPLAAYSWLPWGNISWEETGPSSRQSTDSQKV